MKWNNDNVEKYIQEIELKEGDGFNCFRNDIERELDRNVISKSVIIVKVVSIFGGILAGLLLLGFLFISGALKSDTSWILTGLVLIAFALFAEKNYKDSTWIDSFCLSFYGVGYGSFMMGVISVSSNDMLCWIAGAIVPAIIICFSRSYIVVFLSVIAVNICLLGLIITEELFLLQVFYTMSIILLYTWLMLNEAKFYTKSSDSNLLYNPLNTGMFVSSIILLLGYALKSHYEVQVIDYSWILSISLWGAIYWLLPKIMEKLGQRSEKKKWQYYLISGLVLLPTMFAPAISGAFFLLLLSFYYNTKSQFICSIAMLIYVIIQYYYDLGFSLLIKSGILFFSGIMFLVLWVVFNKNKK